MRAVVLVGGEGTRLRPLTYAVPKQLLPVAGQPMLERVLAHLARHGVGEAVLSLGYRPDAFMAGYPDALAGGVRLSYAVEPEPLDTAGAIRFAATAAGIEETFVVVNGDVLTDLALGAMVEFHRHSGALATIALSTVDDPSRYGVVVTDSRGQVERFVEKPPPGEAPANHINAGTYVLEPEVLDRIPAGRRVSVERETFPALVASGRLFAMASAAYWLDTGTPEAYLQASFDILGGLRGLPPLPDAREVSAGVWVRGDVSIQGEVGRPSLVCQGGVVEAGASVAGAVVGEGCRVEKGAVLRRSVMLAGSVLCRDASVTDSIVGPGAVVLEGARISSTSIVGPGVRVAAGSVVEGARLAREDG